MVGQNEVGAPADEQLVAVATPALLQGGDLLQKRPGVDDHAVTDDAQLTGMEDAGRDQMEDDLLARDIDRVAGVMAALIAGDDVERGGQRSTILPLPSSPHWAPRTTMLDMLHLRSEDCDSEMKRHLRQKDIVIDFPEFLPVEIILQFQHDGLDGREDEPDRPPGVGQDDPGADGGQGNGEVRSVVGGHHNRASGS